MFGVAFLAFNKGKVCPTKSDGFGRFSQKIMVILGNIQLHLGVVRLYWGIYFPFIWVSTQK